MIILFFYFTHSGDIITDQRHALATTTATIDNCARSSIGHDNQSSMFQCNDIMCINNTGNRNGFNGKSLTLMRPPSMLPTIISNTTTSDLYKDAYLRQYQNKLYKLQSFISTPDLTSDSSSGHTSCIEHDLNRESTELQLLRPDVIQMHSFQLADSLGDKHQKQSMPVYQCHHHHQHNQGATVSNVSIKQNEQQQQLLQQKPRQNTTSPITSTRF